MGWKSRAFYLDPGHVPHLFDSNGNAGTTAWVDGRVVGCWVQDADGVVDVRLVEKVPRAGRQGPGGRGRAADRLARRRQGRHGLPVRRDEGCRTRRARRRGASDIVAGVPDDDGDNGGADPAASRGRAAPRRARHRSARRRRSSRPGWPRCAPPATTPRTPRTCSRRALADRLRIDGTAPGSQAQPARPAAARADRRGAAAAGADPLLAAVRRRLVPAQLPRRGPLRRRAGPALPAPPHPAHPGARPRLRHRPLPRRPSRGARRGRQPAGALPALARRARGPTATRRRP